jgi:hypothetical protein
VDCSLFIYIPNKHCWHIYDTDTYIDIHKIQQLPDDVVRKEFLLLTNRDISLEDLVSLRNPKADVLLLYSPQKTPQNGLESSEIVLYKD